jgi:acetolactate synthase-1/2/3 large subunit
LTDGVGVACVTAGPGLTNSMTAVANAWVAASPLLLLAGKVPTKQFDLGALQDVDQLGLLKPITKAAYCALDGDRIPEYIQAGLRHAWSPPYGPAYLELPTDVLREPVPEEALVRRTLPRVSGRLRCRPSAQALQNAIALLDRAVRPVIIAGGGVVWSGAYDALRGLAERLDAPILTTSLARGAIPPTHPLALSAARSWLLAHADVILVVGTRFNYVLGYGRPPRLPANAAVVQIDAAPQELGRNRAVDVVVHADALDALEALSAAVVRRANRTWLTQARLEDADARAALEREAQSDATPIHPLRLCRDAFRRLPADSVIVADGGDILSFARLLAAPAGPRQFLDPGPFGCLGVGVPFANAAKLARPSAPVLCVTGDGALGFHLMEFDTAVRHRLGIVIVVSNNAAWGIEANSQRIDFGADREIGTLLRDCRFDLLARALGGYGERVTDPDDLTAAIDRAFASGQPAIVDVVTDRCCVSPDLRRGLARVPDSQPLESYGKPSTNRSFV